MILHRQGTQPRLIDSSEHSSINLNLRKRNSIYLSKVAFYRDAAVHFCATFLFEAATFVTQFVCLFFHVKFLTILASIVGYEP
jgi:hypothetical protein